MLRSSNTRNLRQINPRNRHLNTLRRDQQQFQPLQGVRTKLRQTTRGTIIEADPGKGGGTTAGDPVWLP